jgi:hypothetical protein
MEMSIYRVGEPIYRVGEPIYRVGEPIYRVGEPIYRVGEPIYRVGEPIYRVWEPIYRVWEPIYRVWEPICCIGVSITHHTGVSRLICSKKSVHEVHIKTSPRQVLQRGEPDARCLNGTAVATTRLTRRQMPQRREPPHGTGAATRCLGNLRTALAQQRTGSPTPLLNKERGDKAQLYRGEVIALSLRLLGNAINGSSYSGKRYHPSPASREI